MTAQPLRDTAALRRISGVIARVEGPSLTITLHLPAGRSDINVAAEIVPESLQTYGQTVWVALDDADGYNRLVVCKRELDAARISAELSELGRSIDALE